MKLVLAGSSSWRANAPVRRVLMDARAVARMRGERLTVIHGGYDGADVVTERQARRLGLEVMRCPPNWLLGAEAGYVANAKMLSYQPDRVVIFDAGGKSRIIEDLVERAWEAHVPVDIIEEDSSDHAHH